jgi:hypothetical protein
MATGTLERYEGSGGETETVEARPVEMIPGSALARVEIDALIATARIYPRSVERSMRDAKTLATITPDVAARCIYAVPRDGKTIEGPSARLAEILQASWGNLRVTGRIVEEAERFIVAQGQCVDLERNSGRQIEVRRRITDRRGRRYSDDMIVTTANAAISIACRNAVLAVIPRALWEGIYQYARKAAAGSIESVDQKRTEHLQHWHSHGVEAKEVYAALGVAGKADIGLEQISTLIGWRNAVDEGEATIESIFRPAKEATITESSARLTAAIKGNKAVPGKPKQETLLKPANDGAQVAADNQALDDLLTSEAGSRG